MIIPHLTSPRDLEKRIAEAQETLDALLEQRNSFRRETLRSMFFELSKRLKIEGFNDHEIQNGWAEFYEIPVPTLRPNITPKFATRDDELCTSPNDPNTHWWSGKGGVRPHWGIPDNLNRKFDAIQIRQIKNEYKTKNKRGKRDI